MRSCSEPTRPRSTSCSRTRGAGRSRPATRSSSPSWTTTPTCRRGCWWPADRELVVRTAPLRRRGRHARSGRARGVDLDAYARGRLHAGLQRAGLGHRRRPGGGAAHAAGALLWVDGVHSRRTGASTASALGADVLLTSPYKYFGPHLGVAAVRQDLAASLPADRVRPADETAGWATGSRPAPCATRRSPGSSPRWTTWSRWPPTATIDRLASTARSGASPRTRARSRDTRCERLGDVPGLTLYGIADPERTGERTPTFCFNLDGWTPRDLSAALGRARESSPTTATTTPSAR